MTYVLPCCKPPRLTAVYRDSITHSFNQSINQSINLFCCRASPSPFSPSLSSYHRLFFLPISLPLSLSSPSFSLSPRSLSLPFALLLSHPFSLSPSFLGSCYVVSFSVCVCPLGVTFAWWGCYGNGHQGMDWPGVRQVPEGTGERGKMEKTGCKIICGAPATLAVKELMMMMMMLWFIFLT